MNFRVKHTVTSWWKSWGKHPNRAWVLSILWILLICWLAFFWNLGNIGLIDETEPLFAEAARQMPLTGDWITPYFNGDTRFDKPPLIYWLMAIGYQVLGVNEWAVRLPSAGAAMILTGLGFYTLRYFGVASPAAAQSSAVNLERDSPLSIDENREQVSNSAQLWFSAFLGSALIALNPETIAWGRTGVSDMLLSGCIGSALLAFFLGYAQPSTKVQTRWYLAFYVLIGLAILTKGPVGIVLPGLIIAAFLIYLGKLKEVLQEMQLLRGLAIILALALPWYVLVIWRNGEAYIDAFFGYHNLQRFTDVVNGHQAPWYFYFLIVLGGFAPWSVYLPIAMGRLRFWQRDKWRASPRSTQLGLFALFWFVGIFGFFTVAVTKLPSYVLPLMPAGAILVTLFFSDQMVGNSRSNEHRFASGSSYEDAASTPSLSTQNYGLNRAKESKFFFLSGIFNVVFLIAIAVAIFCISSWLGTDPAVPKLRRLVEESGLPVIAGIIWATTAIAAVVLIWKRRLRWLWSANLIGLVIFIILVTMPGYFLIDHARQLPLRQLSTIATQEARPGEELIMIGFKKPSVVFYTQRKVTFFKETEPALAHIEQMAAAQPNPPSILLLSYPKRIKRAGLKPQEYQNLGEAGAYQLIRVSKQVVAMNLRRPNS